MKFYLILVAISGCHKPVYSLQHHLLSFLPAVLGATPKTFHTLQWYMQLFSSHQSKIHGYNEVGDIFHFLSFLLLLKTDLVEKIFWFFVTEPPFAVMVHSRSIVLIPPSLSIALNPIWCHKRTKEKERERYFSSFLTLQFKTDLSSCKMLYHAVFIQNSDSPLLTHWYQTCFG